MTIFLFLLIFFFPTSVEVIPFSFENNKILIEVQEKISGKPLKLWVDTGAPTILKRSATFPDSLIPQLSLQIGSFVLRGKQIATHNFNQNEAFVKAFAEVDGLLGYDFIQKSNWKIDWQARKIYLSKEPFPIPKASRLKNIGKSKPMVIAQIEGSKVEPSLVIDTGSPLGINMDQAFFVLLKAQAVGSIQTQKQTLSTWDEVIEQELYSMEIKSFKLDGKSFGASQLLFGTRESHLGTAFLQNYTLVLNGSTKEIGLIDNG